MLGGQAKCLEDKHYKPPEYNIPIVEHGDGSSMMWKHILPAGTGKVVRADGKMDGAEYGRSWNKTSCRPWLEFIYQQGNDRKRTSRAAIQGFRSQHVYVLEWLT